MVARHVPPPGDGSFSGSIFVDGRCCKHPASELSGAGHGLCLVDEDVAEPRTIHAPMFAPSPQTPQRGEFTTGEGWDRSHWPVLCARRLRKRRRLCPGPKGAPVFLQTPLRGSHVLISTRLSKYFGGAQSQDPPRPQRGRIRTPRGTPQARQRLR
eukprot:8118575-Pyramimonas_sp.AAC.1